MDFSETSSLVSRLSTIRSVLNVAATDKLCLLQFDVSTVFLCRYLVEDIDMMMVQGECVTLREVFII